MCGKALCLYRVCPAYITSGARARNYFWNLWYCHHEKWDGTGYSRGLKGEEIPLAARVFAVIDVWDALTSDRPYRDAWPAEKALDYIREQAGTHFDPQVVEVFLKMQSDGLIQDTGHI